MPKDPKELDNLLPSDEEREEIRYALTRSSFPCPDIDKEWEKFCTKIDEDKNNEDKRHSAPWLLMTLCAAAAIALMFILVSRPEKTQQNKGIVFSKIDSPKDMTIQLDRHVAQPVNKKFISFKTKTSTNDGQKHLISINMPRGRECTVELSDGTIVWINAESKLEFPEQFDSKHRTVKLQGEAYFEVAPNKKSPFTVVTDNFSTTAVGTAFNVCTYNCGKKENVVLVEGCVDVKANSSNKKYRMQAGEKAEFINNNVKISEVDTYPYTQRKDGYFYFNQEPLFNIMIELGRWYNKTIVFENENTMNLKLHFVAERTQPISTIIKNLNDIDGVKISMEEDGIIVR